MATRSWKYYRARIEEVRERNVFAGPIDPELDEFVHYHRDPDTGMDYYGVLTTRHRAWLDAQPAGLELTEIAATDIPSANKHTSLAELRHAVALEAATTDVRRTAVEEAFVAELATKGLPLPGTVPTIEIAQ